LYIFLVDDEIQAVAHTRAVGNQRFAQIGSVYILPSCCQYSETIWANLLPAPWGNGGATWLVLDEYSYILEGGNCATIISYFFCLSIGLRGQCIASWKLRHNIQRRKQDKRLVWPYLIL
jgi:hypothetical protein